MSWRCSYLVRRRSKLDIIEDILSVLHSRPEGIPANRLATAANLSYDRLSNIIRELDQKNIVKTKRVDNKLIISITDNGRKLLEEIRRFRKLLEDFGILS